MALDVVFLSYDEPNADIHWELLQEKLPYAKRIHGVDGIKEAHIAASTTSSTSNFFVVDADTTVLNWDVFNFKPLIWDKMYVHIWKSINPINGLIYGYGGIKVFHKGMFIGLPETYVDFSTSIGQGIKVMEATAVAITHFNSSPFHAWRGAVREVAKLAHQGSVYQDTEALVGADTWLTVADEQQPFYKEVLAGAKFGWDYGYNNPRIESINNNNWLSQNFKEYTQCII